MLDSAFVYNTKDIMYAPSTLGTECVHFFQFYFSQLCVGRGSPGEQPLGNRFTSASFFILSDEKVATSKMVGNIDHTLFLWTVFSGPRIISDVSLPNPACMDRQGSVAQKLAQPLAAIINNIITTINMPM